MPKRSLTRSTALIAAAALAAVTVAPAAAAPLPSSIATLKSAVDSPISKVRSRRHSRPSYHHSSRDGGAVAAGIIGGILLGSIIASTPRGPVYYAAPPPRYYDRDYQAWLDYCFSRYRSFDPRSGTYLGFDGRRHYCR